MSEPTPSHPLNQNALFIFLSFLSSHWILKPSFKWDTYIPHVEVYHIVH